jgi:hypothetical protein
MPTALIGGAIAGLGSVAGGLIGASGAKAAANTQAQSAQNALDFQSGVYKQNAQNLAPFINAGSTATGTLSQLNQGNFDAFKLSPDFQFALAQGNRGVQNYENANGLALSGGALKDVAEFNQGLATQNYGNYYNRLLQLSQIGSGAASSLTGANTTLGGTIGNTIQGLGQAQASGIVGSANAINGAIGGGVNNSLLAYKLFGGGGGTGTNTTSAYGNPSAFTPGAPGSPFFGPLAPSQ